MKISVKAQERGRTGHASFPSTEIMRSLHRNCESLQSKVKNRVGGFICSAALWANTGDKG